MNPRNLISAACIVAALVGCKGKGGQPDTQSAESSNVGNAQALSEMNMGGTKTRGGKNCPSLVPGASTAVVDRPDGVEIVVTSPDKSVEPQIRELARQQASFQSQAKPGSVDALKHTGKGTGSSAVGFCPIVLIDTEVAVEDVEGGAKIVVKASDPGQVPSLQKITKDRVQALPHAG